MMLAAEGRDPKYLPLPTLHTRSICILLITFLSHLVSKSKYGSLDKQLPPSPKSDNTKGSS